MLRLKHVPFHANRVTVIGYTIAIGCYVMPVTAFAADPPRSKALDASGPESSERKTWTEEVARPSALGAGLDASQDKPWANGISNEQQDIAERLFIEGNELFLESRFKEAAQKYRESLAHWDHPTTHYNYALTMVNLDDPLAAYKHLRETFKYGGAPLAARFQQEAARHLKTASRQITELVVLCQEPGARVTLDGIEIMVAPNEHQAVLLPGKHTVSVTKPGYVPRNYQLTLVPGEPVRLTARIYDERTLTESKRPLPFWLPVAVTGLGATMVGAGVIMGLQSNRLLSRLDDEVKNDPECIDGCRLSTERQSLQDDGKSYKTWATASILAGSVTLVGGSAWIWFNRKRVRVDTPEEYERRLSIAPVVGSNVLGAMATGQF
jgi:hypothetical protein